MHYGLGLTYGKNDTSFGEEDEDDETENEPQPVK